MAAAEGKTTQQLRTELENKIESGWTPPPPPPAFVVSTIDFLQQSMYAF